MFEVKVLTIIVTYNAMQWVERCFESLRKSSLKPDVFVVDNGSTDGTQCHIQSHYKEVIFHQSEKNLGFGKANNIGLQYALVHNYDYVYLLNQDAWVMPDTFEKLVEISKKYLEYGILSPFQMNADLMHIDHNFATNVLAWKSSSNIVNAMYTQKYDEVYPVSGVMAAHWFMPIETVKKVGGFSPSFSHYGEDDNYIDRLHFWGLKIGVVPSLKVVHDRGWREDPPSKIICMGYINAVFYYSSTRFSLLSASVMAIYTNVLLLFKYSSLKPIINILKVLTHLREIRNNRKRSMTRESAFLK